MPAYTISFKSSSVAATATPATTEPIDTFRMVLIKRLLLRASSDYDSDATVVPVNSGDFVEIASDIGVFSLCVYIRNFEGSGPHLNNSLYNVGDQHYLNGDLSSVHSQISSTSLPNLRIAIKFTPKQPIKGSELLFGNDCTTSIKDYVPTTLLATGLKFFSWFINPTIKGDIYCDSPFLYAPALNSFSSVGILTKDKKSIEDYIGASEENLTQNFDNSLQIPAKSNDRIKFFCKLKNCEEFVFNETSEYIFAFDTNFLRLGDSKYSVAIPTYGDRTFDIDALRYANEKMNNFNWTLKFGGNDGVGLGKTGLILNFSLVDEEK